MCVLTSHQKQDQKDHGKAICQFGPLTVKKHKHFCLLQFWGMLGSKDEIKQHFKAKCSISSFILMVFTGWEKECHLQQETCREGQFLSVVKTRWLSICCYQYSQTFLLLSAQPDFPTVISTARLSNCYQHSQTCLYTRTIICQYTRTTIIMSVHPCNNMAVHPYNNTS